MELPQILQPVPETPVRPVGDAARWSIIRSYLLMRTGIGILGMALPLLLLAGEAFLLEGPLSARGSLSSYYHSGMRDVFVGTFVATAALLIPYKLFEKNLDNTLSVVGGIAALGIALFPTSIPSGVTASLTPLQESLGEDRVRVLHFTFTAIFVLCMAIMSILFAIREGQRDPAQRQDNPQRSPAFWRSFHLSSVAAIAVAVAYMGVTQLTGVFDDHSVLIGESVIGLAFGISWLCKGLELDTLLGMAPNAALAASSDDVARLSVEPVATE